MAYTRTWDDGTPAGTRAASQIDDAIREFKVDIHERMDDAFVEDWTADPLVRKAAVGGPATKKRIIHGTAFVVESGISNYGDEGATFFDSPAASRAPLDVAPNSTITRLRWLVSKANAVLLTCTLKSMAFVAGHAAATLDTRTTSANGSDQILDSGAVAIAIDDTHAYFLSIDLAGSTGLTTFTIHAVEITYTITDAQGLL